MEVLIIVEYVYVNGEFTERDKAKISVFDRGFLYGDGLFETMRAYSGQVYMLEDHLRRLFTSADELEINLERDYDTLRSSIEKLLRLNSLGDAYIRLTISRGIHSGILTFSGDYKPTVVITAKKLHPYSEEYYADGVKLVIGSIRQNFFSPLSRHKSLSYLVNILAKEEARKKGALDSILLNTEGDVAECATSNIFIVHSGKILTPCLSSLILSGVTRKAILNMAPRLGFATEQKKIRQRDLFMSDEVFLTNSIMEVMPVVQVNDEKIGTGRPGPVFSRVAEVYKNSVKNYLENHSLNEKE